MRRLDRRCVENHRTSAVHTCRLNFCVLNCDFGIGVVTKRKTERRIGRQNVDRLTYTELEAHREPFLGLR